MQRNLRHIWGDMMHYRPLPSDIWGDVSPLSPAGFTPLPTRCWRRPRRQ